MISKIQSPNWSRSTNTSQLKTICLWTVNLSKIWRSFASSITPAPPVQIKISLCRLRIISRLTEKKCFSSQNSLIEAKLGKKRYKRRRIRPLRKLFSNANKRILSTHVLTQSAPHSMLKNSACLSKWTKRQRRIRKNLLICHYKSVY